MTSRKTQYKILFVCLGNICRSPTAEGIFLKMLRDRKLDDKIAVDSAGTGRWHVGQPPDTRSVHYAKTRGVDLSPLRARQFTEEDFLSFDLILCMDDSNRSDVLDLSYEEDHRRRVHLLLDFVPQFAGQNVPDPYSGGAEGFAKVFDLVHAGCERVLEHVLAQMGPDTKHY